MRHSLLVILLSLFAIGAVCDELYVPAGGNANIRIVNASTRDAKITVDLLETAAVAPRKSIQVTLAPGEEYRWTDSAFGAIRIVSSEALTVNAAAPIFDAREAVTAGSLDARQSSIGVVNPGATETLASVELVRGDNVIGRTSLVVPARGARLVRIDRLFAQFELTDRLTITSPQRVLLFGHDSAKQTFSGLVPFATGPRRRVASVPSTNVPQPNLPETIVVGASKDATLYETPDGSLANGAGPHLFAGATNGKLFRRAVVAFDLASKIPAGSRITRAVLSLRIGRTISGDQPMMLHSVSADWGEGTSNAGSFRDGVGVASKPDDATWIHRFFPSTRWSKAGGDFASAPDATADAAVGGNVTWQSSATMVARVQSWIDQPSSNFGWIIIGNEDVQGTAKGLESRQSTPDSARPSLTVEFTRP